MNDQSDQFKEGFKAGEKSRAIKDANIVVHRCSSQPKAICKDCEDTAPLDVLCRCFLEAKGVKL